MALFEYGKAEEEAVADMMTAITKSLLPFRERRVPALLVVFALSRLLKAMLNKVGHPLRDQLKEGVVGHITGVSPDSERSAIIIPSGIH